MALPQPTHAVRLLGVLRAQVGQVTKGVEELKLVRRLEQRVAFALAVDVHEQFAQCLERGDGDGSIVDVGGTAAGAVQLPREDECVVGEFFAEQRFEGGPQFGAGDVEQAGDPQFLGPGADSVGRAALASKRFSPPSRSDLPAPVSPVQAQKPGCSSTRTSSIRARFWTESSGAWVYSIAGCGFCGGHGVRTKTSGNIHRTTEP